MATFYQYDPEENNRYVARVEASHQPANSTTASPPNFGDSRPFYWTGSSWSETAKIEEAPVERFYPEDDVVYESNESGSGFLSKKIYHYHPKTKIFFSEDEADESPLEPGKLLVPAHATTVAPPATGEDEVAVFDGSGWIISPKTETEIELPESDPWELVRKIRNQKLNDSDWTQLLDSPLSETERLTWAEYRAKLRDIPQNFDSPDKIVWPKEP